MADFFDNLNQQLQQRAMQGHAFDWDTYSRMEQAQQAAKKPKEKDKGNFFTNLIPSGGGIAGAAGGAALGSAILPGAGTIVGALLGGALGGGAGKVAENAIEGQKNLGEGVGEEALINGILGAGPIRLVKGGIDAARGLKAGASLADAVTQAGQKAANSSVRKAVGSKLTEASNDLVVKNFRLSPTQLSNFRNKFGEDASQVIKKYRLTGKDASTISENAIKPLQSEFDTITKQIPSLPTSDVLKAFKSKYEPLLNSAVEDKQVIGQQLKQQADSLAKKYGAEIPSRELAGVRQEFDSLVNYADKAANPARYGVNKMSADAIRTALQQTADKAGLKASNGMTFKEVGRELSKLHQLTDNIAKQEQLGRGSNPLGITNLLGGGIGSVGGVPGAITGVATAAAVNSGTARRLAANGAENLGARLTEGGPANPFSVGRVAGRIAPVGLLGAQLSSPNQDSTMASPTTNTMPNNVQSMDQSYNTSSEMSSSQAPYSQENLRYDLQRDPQNADKYIAYYQSLQDIFTPQSEPLSQSSRNALASSDNAINTIDQLEGLFTGAGGGSGRIGGAIKGLAANAGFDESAKVYNSLSQASVTQIAKALAGAGSGTVSDMDAKVIIAALPTLQDTPDEARAKFEALRQRLQNARDNTMLYGAGASPLESALMQQGGY